MAALICRQPHSNPDGSFALAAVLHEYAWAVEQLQAIKTCNTRAAKKIAQKLQEISFFSYQHNLYGVLAVIPKNLFSPSELEPSSDIYKMRPKNKRINNSFKIITLWTYIKYNKIFHKYEYIFVKRYIIETSLAKKV